ncbi:MAG: dTMP kinase [Planctomycetes bacterium RBG_13_46_10]|nr:MAG: dTMP kinase [Planctomycetes bacterium RBG_13_46_10]
MKNKFQGKFIVLDGPDGCGKTTQLELLAEYFTKKGIEVVKTHDPGGTKIGDQIRHLLKYGAKGIMDVHTETMLFMASRAQLVAEVIKPAIEKGKTVLCDRFISSTCAYQGSSGYPIEKIIELGKFAVGDVWPDLTIIIDIPAEEGLERTGRKPRQKSIENHKDANQSHLFENTTPDRFDSRTLEYHRKVRKWFLMLEKEYPGVVKIVDGSNAGIEKVQQKILQIISEASFT